MLSPCCSADAPISLRALFPAPCSPGVPPSRHRPSPLHTLTPCLPPLLARESQGISLPPTSIPLLYMPFLNDWMRKKSPCSPLTGHLTPNPYNIPSSRKASLMSLLPGTLEVPWLLCYPITLPMPPSPTRLFHSLLYCLANSRCSECVSEWRLPSCGEEETAEGRVKNSDQQGRDNQDDAGDLLCPTRPRARSN